MDSESRLREMSGLGVDFYRKRGNFDIQADFGKTLQRALCEKGGHHSWEVVQKSKILTGQALLVRLFISVRRPQLPLTHYEPVYQNGEFSGIFGYLARIVPKGIAPGNRSSTTPMRSIRTIQARLPSFIAAPTRKP
ncbi:MAG: hypothetical protein R3D59_01650 [Paracoccaceae bacterium]